MNKPVRTPIGRQKGFTLVELIMVMVLLGLLGAIGSSMISDSFKSTRSLNDSSAVEAEARYGLERLTREIREMKYDAGYAVSAADGATLQFDKGDGTSVRIHYDATGKVLQLDYASTSSKTLVGNVSSFALAYYDINNTPLTLLGDIQSSAAFVRVSLAVTDPMRSSAFTQVARIALRSH